jgi:MFS family permease
MQATSWRWAFFINLPLAVAMYITVRHIGESRDSGTRGRLDWPGAALITAGLASVIYALIELPDVAWNPATISGLAAGTACLAAFAAVEARAAMPMLPLAILRSAQFSGANLTTLTVYAALNGAMFLLAVQLQQSLHSALLSARRRRGTAAGHNAYALPADGRSRAADRPAAAHDSPRASTARSPGPARACRNHRLSRG